jgi:hypothetical protein
VEMESMSWTAWVVALMVTFGSVFREEKNESNDNFFLATPRQHYGHVITLHAIPGHLLKLNFSNRDRERWPNRAVISEVLRIRERQRWPKRAVGLRINECFCRVSGGVLVFSKSLAHKKCHEN